MFRILLWISLSLLLFSAPITESFAQSDSIKLGIVENMSGALGSRGARAVEIYRRFTDQTNEDRRYAGRRIELVVEDAQSNTARAHTAAQRLAQEARVDAIICSHVICSSALRDTGIPTILTVSGRVLENANRATVMINAPSDEDFETQAELAIRTIQAALSATADARRDRLVEALRRVDLSTNLGHIRFDDTGNNVGLVPFPFRQSINPAAAGCARSCGTRCPENCGRIACTTDGGNQCCNLCGRPLQR